MTATPILSNPPAFIVLALVFAVAAYLRQVSEAAEKIYDEIQTGNAAAFPKGPEHTDEKLKSLEITQDKLSNSSAVDYLVDALYSIKDIDTCRCRSTRWLRY